MFQQIVDPRDAMHDVYASLEHRVQMLDDSVRNL